MRNERDDRYEGSDDGEYHYSEDSQFESDAGSEAGDETNRSGAESIESYAKPDNRSRKIVITSIIVFVVLVAVVYKIVTPASSDSIPEIASIPPTTTEPVQAQAQPVQAAPAPAPVQAQAAPSMPQPQAMPAPAAPAPAAEQQYAEQPVMPAIPQQMPEHAQNQPQVLPQQPAPPVIVQNEPMMPPMPMEAQATQPPVVQAMNSEIDSRAAVLAAENAKLASQLQDQYAQQIKNYQEQNKNLEDQVKVLNNRVDTMQAQMNKLLYTLTQTYAAGGVADQSAQVPQQLAATPNSAPAPAQVTTEPAPRVPYNVQAIIPGRAWLRSTNGETLTVAEGDDIKGYGRVTKIDPYDGVVELNINGRTVSLSYGNGS